MLRFRVIALMAIVVALAILPEPTGN